MPSDTANQPPSLPRRETLSVPESKNAGQSYESSKARGKEAPSLANGKREVFENGMKLVVQDMGKEEAGKHHLGGKWKW